MRDCAGPQARPLIPAAQYLRASTRGQKDSIASQEALNRAFAERQGYTIVRTYADQARSGVTLKGRDGLKALLRDVLREPAFAAVLVTDVSRWGRYQDPDEGAHYEFLCRRAGVTVLYCSEAFDNDDSQGALILKTVKRVMAAEFSRQLSLRTRAGLLRYRSAGGSAVAVAPYGFTKIDPRRPEHAASGHVSHIRPARGPYLVPGPPEELDVLRRIFDAYGSQGLSQIAIARLLNEDGLTCRGLPWTTPRVTAVLGNELAIGIHAYGRSRTVLRGPTSNLDRAEWKRVRVFEPLIAPSLWDKAARRRLNGRRSKATDAALIEDLKRLIARFGGVTSRMVSEHGLVSSGVYATRFGSFRAALRLAGQETLRSSPTRWTRRATTWERIEPLLRRMHAERGSVTGAMIDASPDLPSVRTVEKYIGPIDALPQRLELNPTGTPEMRATSF